MRDRDVLLIAVAAALVGLILGAAITSWAYNNATNSLPYSRGYAAAVDSVNAINAMVVRGLDMTCPMPMIPRGYYKARPDTVLYVNGADSLWVIR